MKRPLAEHLAERARQNRDSWSPEIMQAKRVAAGKAEAARLEQERVDLMFADDEAEADDLEETTMEAEGGSR